MTNSDQNGDLLALTTEIVAAHVSNNTVAVGDLPQLINQVYHSLANIGSMPATPAERPQPAVPVKKSVHADYIVCLEDGKKLKMLKRHLKTAYNMTPEAISRALGIGRRLSDGGAELCAPAQPARQGNRPGNAGAASACMSAAPRGTIRARIARSGGRLAASFAL